MIRAIALLLAVSGSLLADTEVPAQFKGYATINRVLKERVTRNGFELGRYVGENLPTPNSNTLVELLGTYEGDSFRNGDPNPINMTLWYLLFTRFSDDIGRLCMEPYLIPAQPEFKLSLAPLCAWPDNSAKTDAALRPYWNKVMGFDAPDEEYAAWKGFFLNTYASRAERETIAAMTVWMLMNPYFLLRD